MELKMGTEIGYVSWEEVNVSSDKGRREVHYYLKRKDGGLDLAVIGKERSLRHMSYHYAAAIINNSPSTGLWKLKSRREVVDWLNSIVSDSTPLELFHLSGYLDNIDASELDIDNFKGTQLRKLGQYTKEFSWLGPSWTCRRRRKHYQSFSRNGVEISVYDFVFVLAEEDKQLVAHLEDMYEDTKGNKMVVVRWYHKIDEVGIALPRTFNDREIFSSLCLQDLSIECINGIATVLSPQHFEKFLKEARLIVLDPFVCYKQFENDDIRPFDITQVKGYWKQEIFRYLYTVSSIMEQRDSQHPDAAQKLETNINDDSEFRPRKRHHRSKDDLHAGAKQPVDTMDVNMHDVDNSWADCKRPTEMCCLTGGESIAPLSTTGAEQNPLQYLKVGSKVEVLSQDSGIRGCWFRALIIKVHKSKVKVRYEDIKDAENEANNLEEWILTTRVAVSDDLGFRVCGRPIIRPLPKCNKGRVLWGFEVGTAVDVWWHDVWQEGIVVSEESEHRFHVYFPGEKQELVFGCADLRHSQEWLGNRWMHLKCRPDILTSLSSFLDKQVVKSNESKSIENGICDTRQSEKFKTGCPDDLLDSGSDGDGELKVVRDLLKDDRLAQLRWNSSKKRRRSSGISTQRMHPKESGGKSSSEVISSRGCERFVFPMSIKVDHENCKFLRDSLFSSAVAQPLTNLIMSR
ncbi:uncharacterized protein LOC8269692 [Ricinus communis]|uniref:DNA binding protein, putative n=1 Tax=Ricinus communis TaxID=3988 RepID=B9ST04_RICCO|nr:uncharacterized protein LOC8269692 [Ricinus communis]EEF33236.1 DNA binding protein, putative [Ricinus communis]|eukprot:XP_002529123.1 uncharacterized protein LOC8269692 [Ricinus communis]